MWRKPFECIGCEAVTRTDLAILMLLVLGTVLVNKYILTRKNNKDDVAWTNQIYSDLNTKEVNISSSRKNKSL